MPELTIRFLIPTGDERFGGPVANFYQWIPDGEAAALSRITENMTTKLWLDRSCIDRMQPVDDELIKKWANVSVTRFFVQVEVTDVTDEVIEFVYDEGVSHS